MNLVLREHKARGEASGHVHITFLCKLKTSNLADCWSYFLRPLKARQSFGSVFSSKESRFGLRTDESVLGILRRSRTRYAETRYLSLRMSGAELNFDSAKPGALVRVKGRVSFRQVSQVTLFGLRRLERSQSGRRA